MERGKLFNKLHNHFRNKRFKVLDALLRRILETQAEVSVLDTGGHPNYWEMLAPDLRDCVKITCLNFQAELDAYSNLSQNLQIVPVVGDACNMPEYADGSFDVVHSNSVIEHVGSYQNMKRFADETRRVGRFYYVQTPNYWFPIEPHYGVPFFHWLPDTWRMWFFTKMNVGYARKCSFEAVLPRVDNTRIISSFLMRSLFPDARIKKERVLGFPKSVIAIRALDR
jgi:2-polyprenyl-3-methyl-5-hydroxy-6-metoxy-1,4-benzoquinol methylase